MTVYTVPWLPDAGGPISGEMYHLSLQIAVLCVKVGRVDMHRLIAVYGNMLAEIIENSDEIARYAFLLATALGFIITTNSICTPSREFLCMNSLWAN